MLSIPLLWVTPFLAIDIPVFLVCAINYSHYLYYIVQISPVNIIFHHIKSVYSTSSKFQKFKAQARYTAEKIPNISSNFLSQMRTRLLHMTWSTLNFNVLRSFVTMATNLPSCFSVQFLEQLFKFLVSLTWLKYVKSQRSYGILITKELIFGFQILELKDQFSASLTLNRLGAEFAHRLVLPSAVLKWQAAGSSNCVSFTIY